MKAFFAANAAFQAIQMPLHVRSRDNALSAALDNEEQVTVHEQVLDPLIYRAASELIHLDDDGQKTDIEAQGQVYDVLQSVEEQLIEAGASSLAASQILDTLKTYVSGLGADFARQARAKPLYARVMVTDKEPTDMPDCKLSSLTCIDGHRIQGDDAGRMSMTLTLYGTSNAMSQGMSMQRVFESGKKKWLMIYYGALESADLNKFDTVDADLATLIQAVGAGGAASVEEIRAAIENGTLAPEVKQLIAAIAELNRTVEASRTPGAIENPAAKIAELKAAIAEIAQTIPDMQALPQVLVQAVAESMARVEIGPETPDVATPVEASNDNDTVIEQTASVLEQLTALLQDEALPPEMKESLTAIVEKMDVAMAEKDFSGLQASMVEVRSALTEFAASDTIPAQMFRTVSEILPAVVVAEKQLGEAVPRAVSADIVPDAANIELGENVSEIQLLIAEKINVLLKDEALPPEIKEQLVKIVQSMESAIDQKDFSKLVIATTEMRQALTDFAANEALPPQITKQLGEILPAVAASEQKLADVVPRAQAENILVALIAADQKLQSGDIVPTPETVQLLQALETLKETISQQGPEAALQKIVESLKAPVAEGSIVPVLDVLAKNPSLLQSLPPELGQALAQAVPPAERSIQQHLAVAGIDVTVQTIASEKVIDVLLAADKQIQPADIAADPAKAELAKIIAEIKDTIKQDGMPAAVEKITAALKEVSVDGKASPILEILSGQPAILAALPVELQASVQQLKEISVLTNIVVTQQAEKIVDVVAVIDQQIKNGALDKADPANAELIKVIADIKETIAQDGAPAAAQKIADALKSVSADGKAPLIVEALASQPALLAALPPELRTNIEQIHKTALSVAVPVQVQAERLVDVVTAIDQKIQSGAIDRADPATAELVKVVAEIKKTMEQGGAPAAVEKITDMLKQGAIDGKSPIIEILAAQPALIASLPAELRTGLLQIQQTLPVQMVVHEQAAQIVNVVAALDRQIQSGVINRADPANAELVKAIADIQKTIKEGGTPAAVEKITEALQKVSVDGKVPPIIEVLATQPALLDALPPQMRSSVEQVQQTALLVAAPVKLQAEKIVDVVKVLDQQIQSGAIDKSNVELIKIVADIQKTIKEGGTPAAVEKITEALKQVTVDGKTPAIIEVLASQPALLEKLPAPLRSSIEQIHQTSEIAAAPARQAQQLVEAVKAIDRQIQTGAIDKAAPANAEIVKAIADIKKTIEQGGTQAAVEKITDAIRQVSVDGKVPPVIDAIATQPAILAALPQDVRGSVEKIQQTAAVVVPPVAQQAKTVADVIAQIDQKIQSGAINKADPANAEVVALVTQIKESAKVQGNAAVTEKIVEALQRVSVDGKVPQIIEVLAKNPAVLAAMPELQRTVQQVQTIAAMATAPIKQPEKIIQLVDAVQQSIQSGAINKTDPANAAMIRSIEDIKQTIGREGPAAAVQKFTEAMHQASVDGKIPPVVALLAKNPAVLAALPPEAQRTIAQFERTAIVAATPIRQHAERMLEVVTALDKTMQRGDLPKADPALARAVNEIKEALRTGGTDAAVLKIGESIKQAIEGGNMPPVIKAVMAQPAILAALPAETRIVMQNVQQKIQLSPVPPEPQAKNIMNAFAAVERSLKSGAINGGAPANADAVKVIAEIKDAMRKDGGNAYVKDLITSIKAGDSRLLEKVAALSSPEIVKSLPPAAQKTVSDLQRTVFAKEASSSVVSQQVVTMTSEQKRDLQVLIGRSNLSPTESQKYVREIQLGQPSVETVRRIVDRVERTSPAVDTSKVRSDLGNMAAKAVAAANVPVPVKIDPVIERKVITAVARLPVSDSTISQIVNGNVTKTALANVIVAAGANPAREVRHFIQEATKQVLKQEGKALVVALRNNPLPNISQRMVQDLQQGKPIPATQIQKAMDNPQTPKVVRQALERYAATQSQVAPYVSPAALKAELKQIHQILSKTNPTVAKAVETFVKANPTASPSSFKEYIAAMPENAKAAVERAAARINPGAEPHFRPADRKEFVQIVQRAAEFASPQDRVFVQEIIEKARMGEAISRSDMDDLTRVTRMSADDHIKISSNMVVAEEKSVIKGMCDSCVTKDCDRCKNAHILALIEDENAELGIKPSRNGFSKPSPVV